MRFFLKTDITRYFYDHHRNIQEKWFYFVASRPNTILEFPRKEICFTKIGFANQPPNDGAEYKYTILNMSLLSDMQIFVLLVIQLKLQFNHEKNISDIGI